MKLLTSLIIKFNYLAACLITALSLTTLFYAEIISAEALTSNVFISPKGADTNALEGHIENTPPSRLSRADNAPLVTVSEHLMSTEVVFTIQTEDRNGGLKAIAAAVSEIRRITKIMSEWEPDSQVSLLNREAHFRAVQVSQELYRILDTSYSLSEFTNGKFDITFKSAGKLWDFRKATIPSTEKIEQAISRIDYRRITFVPDTSAIRFQNAGVQIGLGGIAKGYAVDRAVQIIKHAGFDEFTVNAGGDLYAVSRGQNKLWRVGIRDPRNDKKLIAIVPVANAAVATSGDYERYFIHQGQRYSHIIDPDTGYPATLCQSVTILAPRAFLADAIATGVFVLGPEKGMAKIEQRADIEGIIIDSDGEIHLSSGLKHLDIDMH